MTLIRNFVGWPQICFSAEGGGGEGGAGGDLTTPENVLFGNNNVEDEPDPAKTGSEGEGEGGDWKEYQDDPEKTPEENAALKAEHDKTKPQADDKKADKGDADKVPEDGKYALTMPDGVELDTELADALGPEFKDLGLTNAQAQKLVDKYVEIQTGRETGKAKAWGERVQGWADDAKADKEIGGDKWDGTVKDATRFISKMGTPELKEFLNASGGGNHPELIRIFAKAGALIKEDDPASGGGEGKGKPAEAAYVLFGNDAPKG